MGKKREREGQREDQFGEYGGSQDRRDFSSGFSGRGGRGGGSAGQTRAAPGLQFQRQVPKFLQQFSHLLGRQHHSEDEPVVEPGPGEDDKSEEQDDNVELEALQRAIADNPELASEFGDQLNKKVAQAQAAAEKEKGNRAFSNKDYQEAIACFSRCIELDPSCEVYYSNRSAALTNLEQFEQALEDAKKVIALKPNWVKGHARLAAACMGLKLYSEAREAYEKALKYDPDDQLLIKNCQKATMLELQQMKDNKHTFKKVRVNDKSGTANKPVQPGTASAGAGVQNKKLLSFGDEEEEES